MIQPPTSAGLSAERLIEKLPVYDPHWSDEHRALWLRWVEQTIELVRAEDPPPPPSEPWRPIPVTEEVLAYVGRYGGFCRDCADHDGVCPGSGLPCGDRQTGAKFVIEALNYGFTHGFIPPPPVSSTPVEAIDNTRDGKEGA